MIEILLKDGQDNIEMREVDGEEDAKSKDEKPKRQTRLRDRTSAGKKR